jgi:hypothetical protein
MVNPGPKATKGGNVAKDIKFALFAELLYLFRAAKLSV